MGTDELIEELRKRSKFEASIPHKANAHVMERAADEIERLRADETIEFTEAVKALRWYLGARQVNAEEAAMASAEAIEECEKAEKRIKDKRMAEVAEIMAAKSEKKGGE